MAFEATKWNTYPLKLDTYDWVQHCYNTSLTQITKNIFISDWETSFDIQELDKHNIKTVLCINERAKPNYMLDKYISNGIVHKQIVAYDMPTQDMKQFFLWTYNFIEYARNRGNVLVHCTAGISRSPIIVAHYLLWKEKQQRPTTMEEVMGFLSIRRPEINPNSSFMRQLKEAEKNMDDALRS